jgi:hypothetical protein
MKHLIASFLFLFVANLLFGQNKVTISVVGKVTNFSTSEKLFGATLYMMQNGKTISKAISDEVGTYAISGFISIDQPIDLLVSKPGYASKKVLFDMKTLKVSNGKSTTLQILEELTVELFENREGANLNFTKTDYAEKFTWNQKTFMAEPDQKYKSEVDKKVTDEYAKVKNIGTSKNYVSRGDIANKNRQFEKSVAYYDSAIVATPNDSTIRVKKDIVLGTIKKIQEEETKKANYNSKKLLADTSLSNGDLANAEKNYKEMLNVFPSDSYATGQLAKITSLKNQQELDKKNKAEADRLIGQANTFKTQKKYDEAINKLQQAILLIPNKKDDLNKEINTIKAIQSDILLETEINKDIKNAAALLKDKKYDDAIKTYKAIDQNIPKLSNQPLIDKYSTISQQGAKSVLDKKNLEGEEFKKQLKKAQDNFEKGPAFYGEAEKILKGDPMKSRMNDPEVKLLSENIIKMKDFYKQKTEAYKEVTSKKNNESGLSKLKSTVNYATKLGTIAPPSELSKLNKSIDSLENILKPKNNTPNTTQTNTVAKVGNRLKAPGELITGNPNDAINELAENIEAKKEAPLEKMTDLKNEIDNEAYFNRKLNASRQEDEMKIIQDKKTEIDLKALEQSKVPEQLQENLNEQKQKLETNLYEKQQENLKQNEVRSNQIKDWKNQTDSLSSAKLIEKEKNIEYDMARVQETKNTIELKAINIKNQNEELAETLQKTKTDTEYIRYKQDSLNAATSENKSKELQKKKDYQKEDKFAANNLADENGVPFDKNKMTERVYKIKNKEGFVTTIITRRVVVDKNGYGVVYEQTTNESGNNSFTKNGSPITEYIWANESTGINVIEK